MKMIKEEDKRDDDNKVITRFKYIDLSVYNGTKSHVSCLLQFNLGYCHLHGE